MVRLEINVRDERSHWIPIGGAFVTADLPLHPEEHYEGYTDDNGVIVFDVRYVGRYRVEASKEGYESDVEYFKAPGLYYLYLEPLEKKYVIRLSVSPVEGRVGDTFTFSGSFQYDGEPQVGAEVRIGNDIFIGTTTVNQHGNFALDWVADRAGTFTVYATSSVNVEVIKSNEVTITVSWFPSLRKLFPRLFKFIDLIRRRIPRARH